MDNEIIEQVAVQPEKVLAEAAENGGSAEPAETAQNEENEEIKNLRRELVELKLKLALLSGGTAPEKLNEGVKLAAGLMAAESVEPENAAAAVLREYPHIKLAKRVIPKLSAESNGGGDGFAAIRSIFAKR